MKIVLCSIATAQYAQHYIGQSWISEKPVNRKPGLREGLFSAIRCIVATTSLAQAFFQQIPWLECYGIIDLSSYEETNSARCE